MAPIFEANSPTPARMALEIPVRLVHGLPDAVQVRLAADAAPAGRAAAQRRLREKGKRG
jgi:hypothetical protein